MDSTVMMTKGTKNSCRGNGSRAGVYLHKKTYLYRIIHETEIQVQNSGRCKDDSGRRGKRGIWEESEEEAH